MQAQPTTFARSTFPVFTGRRQFHQGFPYTAPLPTHLLDLFNTGGDVALAFMAALDAADSEKTDRLAHIARLAGHSLLNANVSPFPRHNRARLEGLRFEWRRKIAPQLKAAAKTYRADKDRNAFAELLCGLIPPSLTPRSVFNKSLEEFFNGVTGDYLSDLAIPCEHCDNLTMRDDLTTVGVETAEEWCDACCGNDAIYSDFHGQHLSDGDAVPYYTSIRSYNNDGSDDFISREWIGNHSTSSQRAANVYYVDNDDRYCAERVFLEVAGQDEDEDEDEDEDSDNLYNYHDAPRRWVIRDASPSAFFPPLGVELEVYCENRPECVDAIHSEFPGLFLTERDSSLNAGYGFEIISHPMGMAEWRDIGPKLLTLLTNHNAKAYQVSGNYGIHVNVHRQNFSPLGEARAMMLLCAEENALFAKCISQRNSIYAPNITLGQLTDKEQTIYKIGGLTRYTRADKPNQKKLYGAGKYCPINWQSQIAEFRCFRSTLNVESFMKDLEFVWALTNWVKPGAATGSSWHHKDFIAWLATPQIRSMYPNLVGYLQRPKLYTRGSTTAIANPWAQQFKKPVNKAETVET